jgi:hypothetical protein
MKKAEVKLTDYKPISPKTQKAFEQYGAILNETSYSTSGITTTDEYSEPVTECWVRLIFAICNNEPVGKFNSDELKRLLVEVSGIPLAFIIEREIVRELKYSIALIYYFERKRQ